MSSILRALKKLEEESTPRESENPPTEQKVKKSLLKYRQPGTSPAINKFLVVLAVVLLLGIIGWLIIQPTGKPVVEKPRDTSSAEVRSINIPTQAPVLEKVSSRELLPEKLSSEPTKSPAGAPVSNSSQSPQPAKAEEPVQPVDDKTVDRETKPKHPVLKLTGILWSESPGRRLALINSRYLKEGEKINGVKLIQIAENEVTFQSGSETWTVELER